MKEMILREIDSHLKAASEFKHNLIDELNRACEMVVEAIKNDSKVFLCGNGGSAADAQHIAAELTGRYKSERNPLPGIALTGLGRKGDILIAISTSGNSKNVINALEYAKKNGIKTIGFSGKGGGEMNEYCDLNLVVPSNDTARIQEMHIFMGHTICQAIDDAMKN